MNAERIKDGSERFVLREKNEFVGDATENDANEFMENNLITNDEAGEFVETPWKIQLRTLRNHEDENGSGDGRGPEDENKMTEPMVMNQQ